jgi:glycosyltransferase involved in cell wall biosynthesis
VTAVDVVVLTWNDDPAMLDVALDSALEQQSCAVRLFVVDNGSAPPAVVADERAQVLRQDENLGVGGGRNVGA